MARLKTAREAVRGGATSKVRGREGRGKEGRKRFSLSCCCCSIQHKGGCSCCNRGHRKCDKQLIFIVRVCHFTFYFRSCHTLTHEIHNKSATNRKVVQQIHDKSTTNRISGVWALGSPRLNSATRFGTKKLKWLGYQKHEKILKKNFYSFSRDPRTWQTQTHRHMSFSADEETRFQASCKGGRGQCRQTQFSW